MPQFDPSTFTPQIFWLLVTFAVLFVAIALLLTAIRMSTIV